MKAAELQARMKKIASAILELETDVERLKDELFKNSDSYWGGQHSRSNVQQVEDALRIAYRTAQNALDGLMDNTD